MYTSSFIYKYKRFRNGWLLTSFYCLLLRDAFTGSSQSIGISILTQYVDWIPKLIAESIIHFWFGFPSQWCIMIVLEQENQLCLHNYIYDPTNSGLVIFAVDLVLCVQLRKLFCGFARKNYRIKARLFVPWKLHCNICPWSVALNQKEACWAPSFSFYKPIQIFHLYFVFICI